MFSAMCPLPVRPSFPVYGLSGSFVGFRWLFCWQRRNGPLRGDVNEVSLGHGHPQDGPFVAVETVLKQRGRDLGRGVSVGPVGVEHAASTAVMNAIEHVAANPRSRTEMIEHEFAQIREVDGEVVLDGWQPQMISIDGTAVPSQVRDLGRSQAIVIALPTLVISVWGPTASLPERWELADVTGLLSNYAAGQGETADALLS